MKTAKQRLDQRQQELAHQAKKSLGQNFLISDHVIQKIIQAVQNLQERFQTKDLIEIGPGLGALTDLLLPLGGTYQAIELDRDLFNYWTTQGLRVINADALRVDWSELTPNILVSNLPYQISSSLVIEKSVLPGHLKAMVLMFQKEVAQRIRATYSSDHYGMLSVIAQEFWTIETVCEAGPVDFLPSPKVASRVLQFIEKKSDVIERQSYLNFVKQCFQQRRRILKSNLPSSETPKLMEWLTKNKLSEKVRSEELSPLKLKELYFYLGHK